MMPSGAAIPPECYRGGSGPPLVLLHGLGGSWRAFRAVLPALTARHRVLALTLPGHLGGASATSLGSLSVEALADWIEAWLDEEKIGAAHIAGVSLGGALALELGRRGRASSVVAMAPLGLLEPVEVKALVRRLSTQHAAATRLGRVARGLTAFGWGRKLLFGEVLQRPLDLPPAEARDWFDAFGGCKAFGAIIAALAARPPPALPEDLGCPVCIAWPEGDRMTPAQPYADRFARALPRAAHVRISGAGHIPIPDAPSEVARIILEHASAQASAAVA